jgi:hypothetical protein
MTISGWRLLHPWLRGAEAHWIRQTKHLSVNEMISLFKQEDPLDSPASWRKIPMFAWSAF